MGQFSSVVEENLRPGKEAEGRAQARPRGRGGSQRAMPVGMGEKSSLHCPAPLREEEGDARRNDRESREEDGPRVGESAAGGP